MTLNGVNTILVLVWQSFETSKQAYEQICTRRECLCCWLPGLHSPACIASAQKDSQQKLWGLSQPCWPNTGSDNLHWCCQKALQCSHALFCCTSICDMCPTKFSSQHNELISGAVLQNNNADNAAKVSWENAYAHDSYRRLDCNYKAGFRDKYILARQASVSCNVPNVQNSNHSLTSTSLQLV